MILGAAIWFIVGLAAGYIFYVGPPVLVFLGVLSVIRGFTGSE